MGTGRTTHLVDAIIPVALGRGIFAVLAALDIAHHPDRLPRPPVLGLSPFAVIDGGTAVESQRSARTVGATRYRSDYVLKRGLHPNPWNL